MFMDLTILVNFSQILQSKISLVELTISSQIYMSIISWVDLTIWQIFALYCHWIKQWGHENKNNNRQLKNVFIVKEILLLSLS